MKLKAYICALHAALFAILLAVMPAGSGSMTLLGAGKPGASGGSPTFTFLGNEATFFNTTFTATASTINIGSPGSNRYIIVSVFKQSADTIVGVTVGGVSLTNHDVAFAGAGTRQQDIFSGLVATGSGVQNIVVTTTSNSGFQDCSITAWSGINMTNTTGAALTATASNTSTSTISVNAGDFLVASLTAIVTNSGSTQAPSAVRGLTGPQSATQSATFEWNTISSTNASFSVGTSGLTDRAVATYR